jgi:hypothetical protein
MASSVAISIASFLMNVTVIFMMAKFAYSSFETNNTYITMWIVSSIMYLATKTLDALQESITGLDETMARRSYTFSLGTRELRCLQELLIAWGINEFVSATTVQLWRKNGGRNGERWETSTSPFSADLRWDLTGYFLFDGSLSFRRLQWRLCRGSCRLHWFKGELTVALHFCSKAMEQQFLALLCADHSCYHKEHDRYLETSTIDAETGAKPHYNDYDRYAESSESDTVAASSLSTPLLTQ